MRALAVVAVLAGLLPTVATGATSPPLVRVDKPAFLPALTNVAPSGPRRLAVVSSASRLPASGPQVVEPLIPGEAVRELGGELPERAFVQTGTTLVLYGVGVVAGYGPRGGLKYAFDLRSFGYPLRSLVPRAYGPQEVAWARQLGGLLVVQTRHLGYAADSGGRNGYLTGIDIAGGRVVWRSPSLVANADNFLVVRGLIVSGYGFTAERDWLYLVDPANGRVRDRVALPSMAERLSVRGDEIVVRAYDARVVVRLS